MNQLSTQIHELKIGQTISNKELCKIFQWSPQGGMRRSHRTNSLVIISDHTKEYYDDRWQSDILHYTGMGLIGDQRLNFAQNKTLAESRTNGVNVYLFEVFKPHQYTYAGQVELTESPHWESQRDKKGNIRRVVIFPLRLKGNESIRAIPQSIIIKFEEEKEREARRLPIDELFKRANNVRGPANQRTVSTTMFSRDPNVSAFAKIRAKGVCQLCQKAAPFLDKYNEPYLETHHIIWLSKGGDDSIQNTVALCPNCHKKMHILDLEEDRKQLFQAIENIRDTLH
jgi:5-methylcytosine-specific restriction protein A